MNAKMSFKIRISDILLFLMFFWFVGLNKLESPTFTVCKYIIVMLTFIYILPYLKSILKVNTIGFMIVLFSGMVIIYSTWLNFEFNSYNIRASFFYVFMLIVMFSLFLIYGLKGRTNKLLKIGIIYLSVVLLINDILAIIHPSEFYGIYKSKSGWVIGTFLLGNKFNVSYAHFILMLFFILKEKEMKKRNRKVVVCSALLLLVCIWVQCKTMLFGCVVFVLFYFLPQVAKEVLNRPIIVAVATFFSAFMTIGFSYITSLKIVQNLIINILHRDITLTGRTEVYSFIYRIINMNLLWGNGYGNTVVEDMLLWYSNLQNAFWDYSADYGLIGSGLLVLLILYAIYKAQKANKNFFSDDIWVLVSAIYLYLVMGAVEITFGTQIYFILAMLFAFCVAKDNNEGQIIKERKIYLGRRK